jgi:hypothetical protein
MVMSRVLAAVRGVHAFPVRSAGAEPAPEIDLAPTGVVGDRCYVVLGADGSALGIGQAPHLRDVVARLGPGGVVLDVPDAAPALTGPAADAALSAWLGRAVRVVAAPQAEQLDAPVHLVSVQALDAAARGEHDAADCVCSLSAPRANLVLDLTDGTTREETWSGRSRGDRGARHQQASGSLPGCVRRGTAPRSGPSRRHGGRGRGRPGEQTG